MSLARMWLTEGRRRSLETQVKQLGKAPGQWTFWSVDRRLGSCIHAHCGIFSAHKQWGWRELSGVSRRGLVLPWWNYKYILYKMLSLLRSPKSMLPSLRGSYSMKHSELLSVFFFSKSGILFLQWPIVLINSWLRVFLNVDFEHQNRESLGKTRTSWALQWFLKLSALRMGAVLLYPLVLGSVKTQLPLVLTHWSIALNWGRHLILLSYELVILSCVPQKAFPLTQEDRWSWIQPLGRLFEHQFSSVWCEETQFDFFPGARQYVMTLTCLNSLFLTVTQLFLRAIRYYNSLY